MRPIITIPKNMTAVQWRRYGAADRLELDQVSCPIPLDDELLIKVHASTVSVADSRLRALRVPQGMGLFTRMAFGFWKPKRNVPGMDFSGEVVAVGQKVSDFAVGDEVFGTCGAAMGAHAPYAVIPQHGAVIKKSHSLNHIDAAALVFGGQTALHFLQHRAELKAGDRILINGGSGAVGTMSIQLAKYLEANVTAVCSEKNSELVQQLGADRVIDYQATKLSDISETFDVVMDCVGNWSTNKAQKLLEPNGKLLYLNPGFGTLFGSLFNRRLVCDVAPEKKAYLEQLQQLACNGVLTPVIDSTHPITNIVAAHQRVDSGHKVGNVMLIVG